MSKKTPEQVKINEWDEWRDVIGVRDSYPLPALSNRRVVRLDKLLLLEGGVQVSPGNPNIQVRKKP